MAPPRRVLKGRNKEKQKDSEGQMEKSRDGEEKVMESDWWHSFWQRNSSSFSSNSGLAYTGNETQRFKSAFGVSRKTFDYICFLVRQDLESKPPSGLINSEGRLLTVEKQVGIALRRLASGESQVSVGESFGVGQSTVSQVTWRFIESMEERARHHLSWPDASEMEQIKVKFETIQGLPNCCGAIDATHIIMTLPSIDSSMEWHDCENNYSMVLQGIVDADMRFRDIVTGLPGSMNDSRLLRSSGFFRLCEHGERLNSPVKELPKGSRVREYIVGDTGYPLLSWLITPYQGKDLAPSRVEFNSKHHATSQVAECAFSRLKGTWKFLNNVIWRPDKHKLPIIILVCCLLHNIIIDRDDNLSEHIPLPGHHDAGYKRQLNQFVDLQGQTLRDTLSDYLLGKLPHTTT